MRGYFLTNMYLSPIQCGIQSAHCIHEMFVTYATCNLAPDARSILWSWAEEHKTMIVLNGGTSDDLQEVFDFLMRGPGGYPYEKFYEPGIDGALTCVGVILNEHMINLIGWERDDGTNVDPLTCTKYERELAERLAHLPLA